MLHLILSRIPCILGSLTRNKKRQWRCVEKVIFFRDVGLLSLEDDGNLSEKAGISAPQTRGGAPSSGSSGSMRQAPRRHPLPKGSSDPEPLVTGTPPPALPGGRCGPDVTVPTPSLRGRRTWPRPHTARPGPLPRTEQTRRPASQSRHQPAPRLLLCCLNSDPLPLDAHLPSTRGARSWSQGLGFATGLDGLGGQRPPALELEFVYRGAPGWRSGARPISGRPGLPLVISAHSLTLGLSGAASRGNV